MTDAPQKLWVDPASMDDFSMYVGHASDTMDFLNMDVEYTRTDISQARIAHALSMVANGDGDILKLDAELQTSQTRVGSLEAALKKAMGALADIHDGEEEWPHKPKKELAWCRNRAGRAIGIIREIADLKAKP
jgi:hypothetical protein